MNKLKVELENCYGIKKLNYDFDFTTKPTYAIYAPNGVMKTSFAKTFLDISNGNNSQDLIFKDRVTKRTILDETNTPLSGESIFVIVPYNQGFKSEKISTLLVNKDLKEKYEKIYADIDEKKEILLSKLSKQSGLRDGVEETISQDFTHTSKDFFKAMLRVKSEITDKEKPKYDNIEYQKIFNDKTVSFLQTKDFKSKLKEYINTYNDLLDSSTYFKKGIFNHNNASTIAKNLKENGFFKANHSVTLNSKKTSHTVTTEAELEEIIQTEKDSILNDEKLKKAFEEIDKAITKNAEVRSFREYLENNPFILPALENLNLLREQLWISYLKINVEDYKSLITEYEKGQNEIEKIVTQAKAEKTQWLDVIEEFNKRFFVPFKLIIDNQEDVILKSDLPVINFIFQDNSEKMAIDENDLFRVLSNGELRALYILNIIFEVQGRKQSNQETLFVIDDIADSFDYKNKYAIIEYLKDISNEPIFKQIILTHNFDFYRTVSSRLDMSREHKLNTIRTDNGVTLIKEVYQNNPFNTWKNEFHKVDKKSMLIASIPFVRNIAEYTGNNPDFQKLTSLLHVKNDTNTIKISDLENTYRNILIDKSTLSLPNSDDVVFNVIFHIADNIVADHSEVIELENKITLAIAIRLKAEEFMIIKIADNAFCNGITKNQTSALISKYKEKFPNETSNIVLLEQVNLMTPENIHLNSFMYEPILDMANSHLKQLYNQVKSLH